MKTSGFRCETKFGLLGFLGHPNVDVGVGFAADVGVDVDCITKAEVA